MLSVTYQDHEYVKRNFPDDDIYSMVIISGDTEEVLNIANNLNEPWSAQRHDNTTDCYVSVNNISDFLDIVIEINNILRSVN